MAGLLVNVGVSQPVYARLSALKAELAKSLGRSVSFSEVLELLLEKGQEER